MANQGKYQAPAANALLDVLEFMAANRGYWGPTELARQLDLSPNMIFRTLMVLSDRGYVRRSGSGQYELNLKLFALGAQLRKRFDLRKLARPHLEELAEFSGDTAQVQIPDGERMLLVDCAPPPTPYYLATVPGVRLYYQGNAFGKAVMAFLDAGMQAELFAGEDWHLLTPETRILPELLETEFAAIRAGRCGFEAGEYFTGGYCLAAPVFNSENEVAGSIGISGLLSRREPEREELLEAEIMRHAAAISNACGYGGEYYRKREAVDVR